MAPQASAHEKEKCALAIRVRQPDSETGDHFVIGRAKGVEYPPAVAVHESNTFIKRTHVRSRHPHPRSRQTRVRNRDDAARYPVSTEKPSCANVTVFLFGTTSNKAVSAFQ